VLVAAQERRLAPLAMARALRGLPALLGETPLSELDARATGAEVTWFREGLASPGREDAYWVQRDFAEGVAKVTAAVHLTAGWYDIFLPWLLEDFAALQAGGRRPQLVVGPWTHTAPGLLAAGMRDGIAWLRARLLGDDRLLRAAPVRLLVTGERSGGGWRDLPAWPPPGTGERRLWLAAGGLLREDGPPEDGGADGYRYDPADPTPSLGGPVLLEREPVVDNRRLEARDDVLTYTTPPLPATAEAIGPVHVELWAHASEPHFDLFARVCDVDTEGASWNVCDALQRVEASGTTRVAFELWPMGHRFAAGHRIRLQVSSGAHPRYARNPGTGEDFATATELRAVDVEILHGREHPSALVLPSAAS
jgi:putative CocE/NonD family hydrolase